MATIHLDENHFERLMKYSELKKMSVQEVLYELIEQLELEDDGFEEPDQPSWDNTLPQAIIDLLPKRKKASFDFCEDCELTHKLKTCGLPTTWVTRSHRGMPAFKASPRPHNPFTDCLRGQG